MPLMAAGARPAHGRTRVVGSPPGAQPLLAGWSVTAAAPVVTASRTSSARGVMITFSTYCSISSRSSRPVECCGAPAAARWLRGQPCSGFKGGSLENGLLHVDLVREIQEAMKPRAIPIANSGKLLEVNPPEVAASDRLKFGSAPVFGALARPSDAARGRGFQFLSVRRWSMILLNHRMISVLTER